MGKFLNFFSLAVLLVLASSCGNATHRISLGGGIEAGPVNIGVSVNDEGKVLLTGGFSPKVRVGLGPIALTAGVQKTIELSQQRSYYLFILWQEPSGEVRRDEYEIGKKFQVIFDQTELVRQIRGENDCTIVVVERRPLATPTPTPPPVPGVGGMFQQGDFALTLEDVIWGGEYIESNATFKPAVRFVMRLDISGNSQHLLRFSKADFKLTDDVGKVYYLTRQGAESENEVVVCFSNCVYQDQPISVVVNPGSHHFTLPFGQGLQSISPNAKFLMLTVDNFANQIPKAVWRIPIK